MTRILVIEDSVPLATGLQANLEVEGYDVIVAGNGEGGLRAAEQSRPDLIILDLMLPDTDGFSVLQSLRERDDEVPVLILSARGEEVDKIRGFRTGADDYVTKPFSLMELLARLRALLKRRTGGGVAAEEPNGEIERFGAVRVNLGERTVQRDGQPVHLTPMAFDLLVALLQRRGRVASRIELLREVWGHQAIVQSRTVDAHIAELRRNLEADPRQPRHILTVWKVGYRLQS